MDGEFPHKFAVDGTHRLPNCEGRTVGIGVCRTPAGKKTVSWIASPDTGVENSDVETSF